MKRREKSHHLLFLVVLLIVLSAWTGSKPIPMVKDAVSPPVYDVTIENGWLTMKDGVRVSVTFSGWRFRIRFSR